MSVRIFWLFIFCIMIVCNWRCVHGGRSRASSSRARTSYHPSSSSSSSNSRGGFFNWFRSGNKNTVSQTPKKSGSASSSSSPPSYHRSRGVSSQSHIGFSAYGTSYPSNFHHSHFTPVSHPHQSYFQPQTGIFEII